MVVKITVARGCEMALCCRDHNESPACFVDCVVLGELCDGPRQVFEMSDMSISLWDGGLVLRHVASPFKAAIDDLGLKDDWYSEQRVAPAQPYESMSGTS
jgi:hypothetical protein